jgi:hypothetical protein
MVDPAEAMHKICGKTCMTNGNAINNFIAA